MMPVRGRASQVPPLPPTPRPVGRTPGNSIGLWCARFFAVLCVALAVGLAAALAARLVLQFAGTPVTATVTETVNRAGGKGRRSYDVRYAYTDPWTGRRLADKQSVSKEEYHQVRAGQAVPGRALSVFGYRTSVTAAGSAWRGTNFIGVCAAMGWAVTAVVVHSSWYVPAMRWRLVQHGVEAAGRVTRQQVGRKAKRDFHRLHYAYTAADGTWHGGHCDVSAHVYGRTAVGDGLVVLYDPDRPRRHVVYEFADVHALDVRGQPIRAGGPAA
jgi:hypothetical protein